MNLIFKPETHEYYINGIKVPGNNDVLTAAGIVDYSKVPVETMLIAQKFGTAVHKACELWDKGRLNMNTLDVKIIPYLEAWKKFLRDTKFEIELNEQSMGSEKYMFGTTIDRRGLLNKRRTIVEIKTTYLLNIKSTAIQTAGQLIAHNETYRKEKATDRMAVLLMPSGDYKKEYFKKSSDLNVFLSCLTVANYKGVLCH